MSASQVLATICARGGSKGIPGKNIRELLDKPLIVYAIETARACPEVGHIVISTDSDEIAAVAEQYGVPVPFRRPEALASDTAAKIDAIRHATKYVEQYEGFAPDVVVDLDIGVPLREPRDISACVEVLKNHTHLDAAVTVYEAERSPYFNMVEFEDERVHLVKKGDKPLVRRQDAPAVYSVSPSVFAWRRSSLWVTHLFEGQWGACVVPRIRAIDIDDEVDFQFAEFLMTRRDQEAE